MLTLVLGALMWLVARHTAGFAVAPELRWVLLSALGGAGLIVGSAAVWAFHRARTTVNPWRPQASSALVVSGIYRRTRNPMYLGLALALAGWGLYLANVYALLLACTFVPYMNRFQIRPEERVLQHTFGNSFREYCRQVRRWL
jgi:protein-S-isoprenylcysteine O-methyltransferase Ste14